MRAAGPMAMLRIHVEAADLATRRSAETHP